MFESWILISESWQKNKTKEVKKQKPETQTVVSSFKEMLFQMPLRKKHCEEHMELALMELDNVAVLKTVSENYVILKCLL